MLDRFVDALGWSALKLLWLVTEMLSDLPLVLDTGCEPESVGLARSRI